MEMRSLINIMEGVCPELVEIAPPPSVGRSTYWHGTDNAAGVKIMKTGLQGGGSVVRKIGSKIFPSNHNGVYLTRSLSYASEYAMMNRRSAYGWVFAVDGTDLVDVDIDEDEVGKLAQMCVNEGSFMAGSKAYFVKVAPVLYEIYQDSKLNKLVAKLSRKHLPSEIIQRFESTFGFDKSCIEAGRILSPYLTDDIRLRMIEAGCHIVSFKGVVPTKAYRFDIHMGSEIKPETIDMFATRFR